MVPHYLVFTLIVYSNQVAWWYSYTLRSVEWVQLKSENWKQFFKIVIEWIDYNLLTLYIQKTYSLSFSSCNSNELPNFCIKLNTGQYLCTKKWDGNIISIILQKKWNALFLHFIGKGILHQLNTWRYSSRKPHSIRNM